jgi:carbon monoxide dehydrogenase subunit G
MRMEGQFTVERPKAEVLAFFRNLANIVPHLPGLQEIRELGEDSATVVLRPGVAFIRGLFTVRLARIGEGDDELVFRGQGTGVGSAVDLEARLRCEAEGPTRTVVRYLGEARVGGTLASLGAGLLEPVVRQNLREFIARLEAGLRDSARQEVGDGPVV